MSGHRPRMHQDEVSITEATVRSLLSAQFPEWSGRSLVRLRDSGTDNAIYRLGYDLGIRMPRIGWAVQQIDKEFGWLGKLAHYLPAALPVPIAKGEPGSGYPYPWLVYPWLDGVSLDRGAVSDWSALVQQIGDFVLALERVPVEGAPRPRTRGAPVAASDESARVAIRNLRGSIDTGRASEVWQAALDAPRWPGDPVWIHGDLLPGNILVRDGRLAGVIDWGGASAGDPACDAMLAWALPRRAREEFRTVVGFDDATWARARGWVVQQTTMYITYYEKTLPEGVEQARLRLHAALTDEG
jgi:aminoglycoside phosphotransferase (APT) family kinase protein